MTTVMPATDTPFGERVARRLQDEKIIWMTTVGADGTPQPNPIWFLWDGTSVLMYSQPHAARLPHLRRNARVALNFDGDGQGGDIIVLTGEGRLSPDDPPADRNPAYIAKYGGMIAEGRWATPAGFAADYSLAVRITVSKVRGF